MGLLFLIQVEYVVGALCAVMSAKLLVASALSLLGALNAALENQKLVFPSSQQGGCYAFTSFSK